MIVVNTETIPGMRIVELKGLVQGNTVRAKHVGRDIAASFKTWWAANSKATRSSWWNPAAKPWRG